MCVCLSFLSSWPLLAAPHAPAVQVEEYLMSLQSLSHALPVRCGLVSDDLCSFLNACVMAYLEPFQLALYRAARDGALKPNSFHTDSPIRYSKISLVISPVTQPLQRPAHSRTQQTSVLICPDLFREAIPKLFSLTGLP